MTDTLQSKFVNTNGIVLHTKQGGNSDKPCIILLHGFPEFWFGWKHQIKSLIDAGFRVVVPDQRGYNLSSKPKSISSYGIEGLTRDILGLMDSLGEQKVYLAGHDWGAVVAWWIAIHHPHRLKKLVILNVPHPYVMQQHLFTNRKQRKKSWYVFYYQLPFLPEWTMSRKNWEYSLKALTHTSRHGTFNEQDLKLYKEVWSQPGALMGMINWYRAAFWLKPKLSLKMKVSVPTLMIWGAKDRFLGKEMAQPSIEMCENVHSAVQSRLEMLNDATHWVQHEEPERVNELMIRFFKE